MPSNLVIFLVIMAVAVLITIGLSFLIPVMDRKEYKACSKTHEMFDGRKR